ncbi:hypothetical protein IAU60_002197 [Kwoniella sp. DSM 27419]
MSHGSHYELNSPDGFRRQTYHHASGSDSSNSLTLDSPMTLPALLPTDPHGVVSPTTSDSILTPDGPTASISTPKMGSDHSMLASMSQQPTPKLSIPSRENGLTSRGFPLLPPHHPLRSKMYSSSERSSSTSPTSPAHTPKGHPIERSHTSFFNFAPVKDHSNPLTNPFSENGRPYTSSLAYLLRVPRRLRPVLLIGFCVITFGFVMLNRAMSHARHMESHMLNQRIPFTRREMFDADGLRIQHPVLAGQAENARSAEAAVQAEVGVDPSMVFLNAQEELAALISFVTSTTANALPPLDPAAPLDPHVVLDFDPSHPNAREDMKLLQSEINTIFPIVVLGKMRDPWHREIKRMLAEYKIIPAPLIIDVDQRRDHATIIPLLARLLSTDELPQMLLLGHSLGSYHDILDLRDAGKLAETLEASGSVSMREVKKKKGIKEKERIENERILGPAPII